MPQAPLLPLIVAPSVEYLFLLSLGLFAGLYFGGLSRFWSRPSRRSVIPTWRVVMFCIGLGVVLLSLFSPIGVLNNQFFAAHMAQHLMMTLIAAPLILLGAPLAPTLWALPDGARTVVGAAFARGGPLSWLGHQLTRPLVALPLHIFVVGLWHVPSAYEGAVLSGLVHDFQHASFFGTALLFWWPVIHPLPGRIGMPYPMRLVYLGAAMLLQSKVLGALLTFAGAPVYRVYADRQLDLGYDPAMDQQLGGLLMLVVAAIMMLVAVTAVFFTWAAREKA